MTTTATPATPVSPSSGLPHWETLPDDLPAATAEIKAAIRARIEASGRTVAQVVDEIETFLEGEIADIEATRAAARRSGRSSTTPTWKPEP